MGLKMLKKMMSIALLIILTTILLQQCDATEPSKVDAIIIQELDVAVSEAYIHLCFETEQERNLVLFRNGEKIINFSCSSKDTILTDAGLKQNTNYKYKVKEYRNNSFVFESNVINITTIQPTKQDFDWETYTINTHSQSTLSDIYIINRSDIWIVGEFYFDSDVAYGFIHWDGNEWAHFRIFAEVPPTNYQSNIRPTGVYAFDSKNVWFSAGSVFHWDGETLTPYWLSNFEGNTNPLFEKGQFVRKIWGDSNAKTIYVCGDQGALAVFRDNKWESIPTNLDFDLLDIWGYESAITKMPEVICATSELSISKNILIKILNINQVNFIPWDQQIFLFTLWTNKGFPIFAGGSQSYSNSNGKWQFINLDEEFIPYKIRGSSLNNIFICGSNAKIFHFNGRNWRNVSNNINAESYLTQITIKDNIVVIGGEYNGIISIHITQL